LSDNLKASAHLFLGEKRFERIVVAAVDVVFVADDGTISRRGEWELGEKGGIEG